MKIIATHTSPDLDAISSVWLIRKFLPGWENAELKFVAAGERLQRLVNQCLASSSEEKKLNDRRYTLGAIERIGGDEVIHVDTGMGVLDHHQTDNLNISAASLVWEYVKRVQSLKFPLREASKVQSLETERQKHREEAVGRIVKLVVDIDHFQEVFWDNPTADFHEFSLLGILEGLEFQKPGKDKHYVDFISQCLDILLHNFENRIWAEDEIAKKGVQFKTKWGKGLGVETINDTVMKLGQKMGYVVVVRKDPRKGFARVKARPLQKDQRSKIKDQKEIDLTPVCEKLRKMDPEATWFLHVSKKMLLNGTSKNPKMRPTKLSLNDIIKAIGD